MIRALLKKVRLLTNFYAKQIIKQRSSESRQDPLVIPRSEHGISRKDISENALKVLYRLHRKGYQAYLVGGGVRDLLLGLHPKDFDVVTDATPDEIRQVFRNCRLIGRRFRLAHVYFGHDIVEVATFRGMANYSSDEISHSEQGMILRDNVYGSIAEDVWRRDFTVNALYYNIADFSIVDYCGGFADLKNKQLRIIGEVGQRYREDPVRMLRAIRFACKMGFNLPNELTQPMNEFKVLISHVSAARLFEEMIKMFHSGAAFASYESLVEYGLFAELFPATAVCLNQSNFPTQALFKIVFQSTDARIQQHKTVTPAFIIATLLWHPICKQAEKYVEEGVPPFQALGQAIEDLLRIQAKRISVPKRIVQGAREIWLLQLRFAKRQGKRAQQLMAEHRFRAAYDFLEIRALAGEPVAELASWWKDYIEGDSTKKRTLLKSLSHGKKPRKRRKKPRASNEVPPAS